MGELTGISWADSTLNIWAGCTKVSNGPLGACEGCYAEHLMDTRMGRAKWGPHAARVEMKGWRAQLRKISRLARAADRPWFVFVNSLSDFWDNQADPALRKAALLEFALHPHVTFLLLTKRPQNIVKMAKAMAEADLGPYADEQGIRAWWPSNVALGCTVVTQEEADRDVPHLLAAKEALNPAFAFLSMEPLMGPVDISRYIWPVHWSWPAAMTLEAARAAGKASQHRQALVMAGRQFVDWVIAGGETDQGKHKARPSNPQWFRDLRDQCAPAKVAFHFKQNGEWVSVSEVEGTGPHHTFDDHRSVRRIGKKAAGRALDGVVHDARPQVAA